MKIKFKKPLLSAFELKCKRERDHLEKLENTVIKRRKERDEIRKAFTTGEGVNWKRVVLMGKLNGNNTPYIIKNK